MKLIREHPAGIVTALAVIAVLMGMAMTVYAGGRPIADDLGLFIMKYGQPDRIKVSGMGTSQASKQLIYAPENVRVVFVPAGMVAGGAAPRWKFLNIVDLRTNRVLTAGEAKRRLAQRKKR